MINNRKAEISITFNWIYVAIAGAVILLFFTGLIIKSKTTADQQLSYDVITLLDSIFTGAQSSENTKTPLDTSGLVQETLLFDCEDRVTSYRLQNTPAQAQAPLAPIFSPTSLQSPSLLLWSLPYKFPFKVIDFLFVTSPNTKYFLLASTPQTTEFANEFAKATQDKDPKNQVNTQLVPDAQTYSTIQPQNNYQVRFIDLEGTTIPTQAPPAAIRQLADSRVSAVAFQGNVAHFYQKKGSQWIASPGSHPEGMTIASITKQRDAAKYAAIFAGNELLYRCNMQKAFERLWYVSEVYGGGVNGQGKLADIISYYTTNHPESACLPLLQNLIAPLHSLNNLATTCTRSETCAISDLILRASDIENQNLLLSQNGCLTLY